MSIGAARTPLALLVDLLWTFAAVAVFVHLFARGDGPAPSMIAVSATVLGSFALSRVLQLTDLDETKLRLTGIVTTFVLFFLVARLEYSHGAWPWDFGWVVGLISDPSNAIGPNGHVISGLVALAPFWLRGIIRGQSSIEFEEVLASASIGLLIVIMAALAAPDTREPLSWGLFALTFAVLTLMTLALYQSPEPDQSVVEFGQRSAPAIATIVGVAVALAVLAATIDPDAFGLHSPPFSGPLTAVGRLIGTYVLAPVFAVIALPFRFAAWLFGLLIGDPPDPERPELPLGEDERPDPKREDTPLWFRVLLWTGAGLSFVALTAIVSTILWFAFRRFVKSRQRSPRERRETVEPASSLVDDLGDLLGALAKRFRRSPRPRAAVQIRRLYFRMLDSASARGLERPVSATPLQFAPSLDLHFASDVPSSITHAFAASRYGELAIDAEIVRDLEQRWRVLELRSHA